MIIDDLFDDHENNTKIQASVERATISSFSSRDASLARMFFVRLVSSKFEEFFALERQHRKIWRQGTNKAGSIFSISDFELPKFCLKDDGFQLSTLTYHKLMRILIQQW